MSVAPLPMGDRPDVQALIAEARQSFAEDFTYLVDILQAAVQRGALRATEAEEDTRPPLRVVR